MFRFFSKRLSSARNVLIILCGMLGFSVCASAAEPAILFYPNTPLYSYRWKLLQLALDHTRAHDGPLALKPFTSENALSQARSITMLQNGGIDVLSLPSTPERELELRPIRIDILRGMLGYRILLIRKQDQALFRRLNGASLRQTITLGFNSQWADMAILQSNGFHITTSYSYDGLFAMLAAGRFDAFPRGITEINREMKKMAGQYPNIAPEQSLALFYDLPVYFWVRKDNARLADRIERGLQLALQDGSFRHLFRQAFHDEIVQIATEKRRVIRLHNPWLNHPSVAGDTSWWWQQ